MPARQAFDLDIHKLPRASVHAHDSPLDGPGTRTLRRSLPLPARAGPQGIEGDHPGNLREHSGGGPDPVRARLGRSAACGSTRFPIWTTAFCSKRRRARFSNFWKSQARSSIEEENPKAVAWTVLRLLRSRRYPALGVVLARGAIASSEAKLGDTLLKAVREVLDANDWNPFDPADEHPRPRLLLRAGAAGNRGSGGQGQIRSRRRARGQALRNPQAPVGAPANPKTR